MREFLTHRLIRPIGRRLGADDCEDRAGLLMSQIVGLTAARHTAASQPPVSSPREDAAAGLGDTLQR